MIRGVDCAWPQPSYPSWAEVVAGYAGGHTQHQWTLAEVQAVQNMGRVWFAIWTARNKAGSPPLTAADGIQDSTAMAARLPYYQYDKTLPVFYDIEPGIYDLDPNGAKAAIGAWKAGMQRAGYPQAYVYTIRRQGGDWIADWTNVLPAFIPPGTVGIQYGGDQGSFDYDVFIDALLTGGNVSANGPENWDANDWQAFRSQVAQTGTNTGVELLDAARTAAEQSAQAVAAVQALAKVIAGLQLGATSFTMDGTLTPKATP